MQIVTEGSLDGIYEPYHMLVRKWFKARKSPALPELAAFERDSSEMGDYRMLSRIKQNPLDIFYYEAGKKLETLYGDDLANKNLEELYNSFFRKRAYEGYKKVIQEKLPVYEQRKFSTIIGSIGYYKIHLPFGDDEVKDVATYIVPTSDKIRKRFDWVRIIDQTPWF